MKTIYRFIILFFAVAFTACQDDINDFDINDGGTGNNEVVIEDGKIQSPRWLAHVVDSVARTYSTPSGDLLYPWVYSVKYNDKEYIYVLDALNSCAACGSLFFTLSGEPIKALSDDAEIDLYNALATEENHTLLWRYKNGSLDTKAFGSSAYVYTPNNSLVSDTYYRSEELTSTDKSYILSEMSKQYPQATVIAGATTTYNCHAYAWHMTEGGSAVWMGRYTNPTVIYRHDGSYISTSGAATKIAYLSDNHSAAGTGTPDIFISKWGAWPLMRHHKDYSPYNSSTLGYYKENDMPPFYISKTVSDYSGNSTIYAVSGNAGITLNAYATNATPTSYVWSANFYGDCDRWYIWPNGSSADISIYLDSQHSGGTLQVVCAMYNGNTLLGSATYYLLVYP